MTGEPLLEATFSNSCCHFLWALCSAQPLPRTMANMSEPWSLDLTWALGTDLVQGDLGWERPLWGTFASPIPSVVAPHFLCSKIASSFSSHALQLSDSYLNDGHMRCEP